MEIFTVKEETDLISKFNKNVAEAKKRLSKIKRISDQYEKDLMQSVSHDITTDDFIMRNCVNVRFLKSNDSVAEKPIILNWNTSMSMSPVARTITPANILK